jgi:LacI family transcriptional regulator
MAEGKQANVTTADIARHTGLSKMTVSRVLNNHPYVSEQTREKVMTAVRELGFRPNSLARRFFTGKTRLVGLVIPLEYMMSSFYFKEVFQGVREILESRDYDILLHDSDSPKTPPFDKCLELVKGKLAEGLLMATPMAYDEYPAKLVKEGVPLVVMGETGFGDQVNRVTIPNRHSSEEAVQRLVKAGHRRIAVLTFGAGHVESSLRYQGYEDALQKANIEVDPKFVGIGRYNRGVAYEETRRLLTMYRDITAVYAVNADMALGAADAIRSLGLSIPEDISLLSFDDCSDMEMNNPPITAVRQYPIQVGRFAALRLLDMLEKDEASRIECRVIETEFVSRASIAPPSPARRES